MHEFSFFLTNHKVSAIKKKILAKTFTRCSKKVSTIVNVRSKSVRYTEVFLWEFDRDLAGSLKNDHYYQVSVI